MTYALLLVACLLLIGVVMRESVSLFRWLFIPASVIAGLVGLVLFQANQAFTGLPSQAESPSTNLLFDLSSELSSWPGWLIAVVFAGMLLVRNHQPGARRMRRVGQQGLMVWIIVLGETAVGLLATWLIVQSYFEVPNSFGMLIETGFAGGHGTAAAMGEVFANPSVNLVEGKDLGMLMATCGLVYGIVTGIFWINVGVRRGWVSKADSIDGQSASAETGRIDFGSIGTARINRETIDPLLLQVVLLAIAFGIGVLMQSAVQGLAGFADSMFEAKDVDAARAQLSKRLSISNVVDFPLFIYTLFGGMIVQKVMSAIGQGDRIDGESISRLTSIAMDVLVVAAIATLNLQAVAAMLVPFSILFVVGGVWTAICLLLISRWLLPKEYWFQLGLVNYGMSTGTTATGFVLLRMVDPNLESDAAQDYALAAPLSAPFIGGGMITIALPLLLLEQVSIAIPALVISGVVVAMVVVGKWIFDRQ